MFDKDNNPQDVDGYCYKKANTVFLSEIDIILATISVALGSDIPLNKDGEPDENVEDYNNIIDKSKGEIVDGYY